MLERIFKSKAEVKVLGVVLFSDGLHLREIARRADLSPSEAKRELDNLVHLGVLKREEKGKITIFYLDARCPFISELKSLYLKTEGVFAVLKKELSMTGLKYALAYGSMAKGTFIGKSDVDLLLIGDIDECELERMLFQIQKTISREINYILWKENEYKQKVKNKGAFIESIRSNPITMLVGDYNEFVRAGEKRRD